MHKVQLTPKRVLQFIILGIQNGNYQAAIDLAQDCIDQLERAEWEIKPVLRKEITMSEEKLYIGAKLIRAIPMSEFKFKASKGKAMVGDDRLGYQVKYPDGYISWSPKETFEIAYREVTAGERELF